MYAKLVKLQKVDAFNPVIGGYDKLAITFGYMPVEELLKWLFVLLKRSKTKEQLLVGRLKIPQIMIH